MLPSISIISVSYHTGPVLFEMISSALAQDAVAEVILVDNGNPVEVTRALEMIAAREPRLKIIQGQGNVGFAAACNLGAAQARGDYLMFVNPDCILPPDMARALLDESARHAEPHLIGVRMLDKEGREQSGSRRAMLTPVTALVEALGLARLFPQGRFKYHEDPLPPATVPMPAISGALMFLSKHDFEKVGRFDEDYFLHVDDLDLCLRMKRMGGEVYFMPAPAVMHHGATSKVSSLAVERHKAESFVKFFYKNYSKEYPAPLLWLVTAAIWVRFGGKAVFQSFFNKI